ncbi:NAD(P)/FAD-dependent oxidoreductase [Paralimibaculum aggregatum]|uniref:NAD(P)/FAD-dependent oxidoreductase n=1 Tax=Paralimibaculum aggregatum TaxID=3036245 RepID=A0ABQ6LP13_9RHOB|nr:NAD(P)/FAD-dependent oxidoreductase [Limibaculum sp. NKW23]GMG82000.1 NAD(P)/FAD-dependent oxidoreductase [Limibaculum sp. NKW23]
MRVTRRRLIGSAAAGAAALAAPAAIGAARPHVVVIGGGAGGATAARYLARDGKGAIAVTLVEPTRTYHTCFFSNLYLGGFRTLESIAHSYGRLAAMGINVVHDWAVGIDRDTRTVALAGGGSLGYDRLIVAPGIDFRWDSVPGHGIAAQNAMPHAWKAGSQTELLKAQIASMPEGGVFAMVAPPNPYRCPPGPYERVSMVAHQLSRTNPTAKIMIFDPKPKFSKQALFEEGWAAHYPGMIEWLEPDFGGRIDEVRPDAMEIVSDGEAVKVDVANVIPAQKAGRIAEIAGLADASGFCPIVPATMQSRMDPAVHVLGDATIAGDMPKSGFSANSQAKVAAMAVRAALTGSTAFPPRFSNTCWSLIATGDGVKVGARYEATEEKIAKTEGFISQTGEDAELRRQTYEESLGWYAGITADIFG